MAPKKMKDGGFGGAASLPLESAPLFAVKKWKTDFIQKTKSSH